VKPPAVSLPSGAARFGRSQFGEGAGPPFSCAQALAIGQTGMREMDEQGETAMFAQAARAAPKPAEPDTEGTRPVDAAMDRYARGDDAALDELYRLGAPRVRSFLARLCADLTLADDLTQDAFLRVHSARGQFAAGAPAMPWMFAIARNSYRDHLRREQVRREHRSTTAQLAASQRLERPEGSGDRALIAQQMLDIVQRTLMSVPVRQREAFVLMRFEGLDLAEAARVLGATEAAVKILVHRAYVAVRAALEKQRRADGDSGKASPR
jgi:RNA polymerase sigma-70 factor, ECF subfamily